MKKERLFRVLGMVEEDFIKEAEDEKNIKENIKETIFVKTGVWKWTAAAAGILLVAGLGLSKSFLVMNGKNTSTTDRMENAAQPYAVSNAGDGNETGAKGAEPSSTAGALWEDSEMSEECALSDSFYEDKIVLYLEIIKEVYESYEGKMLYLDLEKASNLTADQKEILQEALMSQYGMEVIAGNFAERSRTEELDKGAAECSEIYLSIEVTEEKENRFAFTVSAWIGKNTNRTEYCAEYSQDGWNYEIKSSPIKQ